MRRRIAGTLIAGVFLACVVGGCVSGSLATNTGARAGESWATASRQPAHVGETVQFSFVLKRPMEDKSMHALGVADYCVFDIGGERYDVDVDESGAFRIEHGLTQARAGDKVRVTAVAYREYGPRDHRRVAGEWLKNQSPQNEPDQRVASARVTLEVYQSSLELDVPPLPDGLDPSTARLVLRPRGRRDVVLYAHRPPRRGFTFDVSPNGGWRVTYLPSGDEVNPTGATPTEFSIFDNAGNRHEFRTELATP
jgi:hypothetical protein